MARKRTRPPTAGQLRHRVKIENWIETPDDDVGIDTDHKPIAEVWADVQPLKSMQVYGFQINVGQQETPTHKIVLRNPSDVLLSSQHFFYTQTRREKARYKILMVQPLQEDERWIECLVQKRAFRDVRADPAVQTVPAEDAEEQQNQMQEQEMDSETLSLNVRPDLGRFRR